MSTSSKLHSYCVQHGVETGFFITQYKTNLVMTKIVSIHEKAAKLNRKIGVKWPAYEKKRDVFKSEFPMCL